jgi:hypothetical protein
MEEKFFPVAGRKMSGRRGILWCLGILLWAVSVGLLWSGPSGSTSGEATVRLRGTIVRAVPCRSRTELDIEPARPGPFLSVEEERLYSHKAVIVVAKGFLDPAIFSPGRVVRIVGVERTGPRGTPVLWARRLELWPRGVDVDDLWDSGLYVRAFPPWNRDPFYPVWWGW